MEQLQRPVHDVPQNRNMKFLHRGFTRGLLIGEEGKGRSLFFYSEVSDLSFICHCFLSVTFPPCDLRVTVTLFLHDRRVQRVHVHTDSSRHVQRVSTLTLTFPVSLRLQVESEPGGRARGTARL